MRFLKEPGAALGSPVKGRACLRDLVRLLAAGFVAPAAPRILHQRVTVERLCACVVVCVSRPVSLCVYKSICRYACVRAGL